MEKLQVGDLTLYWLNGGVTHLDGGAMFGVVPRPLWTRKYPVNEHNQIELRTDPIYFTAHGKHFLIESGIGFNKMNDKMLRNFGVTEQSSVESSLAQLGVTPNDIDYILMTHMHFDHACGLTHYENDELVSTFPNAKIMTSTIEWAEMREPNVRSKNTYWPMNWEAIMGQVETFDHEVDIVPGVRMVHTGGHSDGHSIVLLESNGEYVVHFADLMPTHAHQNPLWVMAYDDFPMVSIPEKQKWQSYALERKAWITFYHDAIYRALKWDEQFAIVESVKRARK